MPQISSPTGGPTQERHNLMLTRCLLPLWALVKDSMILNYVNNKPKRRGSHRTLIFEFCIVQPARIMYELFNLKQVLIYKQRIRCVSRKKKYSLEQEEDLTAVKS